MNREQYARNRLAELRRQLRSSQASAEALSFLLPEDWSSTRDGVDATIIHTAEALLIIERELEHVRMELSDA